MKYIGFAAGLLLALAFQGNTVYSAISGGLIGFLLVEVLSLSRKIREITEQKKPSGKTSVSHTPDREIKPIFSESKAVVKAEESPKTISKKIEKPRPSAEEPPPPVNPDTDKSDLSLLMETLKDFLAGTNTAVIAGVIILFIGLVFLFKYAIEHSLIPVEVRLIFAGVLACIMLFFGWRLRVSRTAYALILQGAGSGILYLTIFVAFRIYKLIPSTPAFAFLFLVMVFSMALAVMQNSLALALISTTGGFLAPILTSTGSGNYIALFSYYAVINSGILAVAFYRSWRVLNLAGFLFTFGIGAIWGALEYKKDYLVFCDFFLILFFLMYAIISILFAIKQAPNLKGIVDGTLVFALPLAFIGMQYYLVHDIKYSMAYSALGLGIFYLGVTSVLFRRVGREFKVLLEAFLSLGVIFSSLAIPLAFDAPAVSALWAFEGAGLIWVGLRQNRLTARIFGFLLQAGAWYFFLIDNEFLIPLQFFNGNFIGLLILSFAGLFAGSLYRDNNLKKIKSTVTIIEQNISRFLTAAGIIFWYSSGHYEFLYLFPNEFYANSFAAFCGLSTLGFFLAGKKVKWPDLQIPVYFLLLFLWIHFAGQSFPLGKSHPFAYAGFLIWPLNFIMVYFIFFLKSQNLFFKNEINSTLDKILHMGTLLLLDVVLTFEIHWQVTHWLDLNTLWSDLSIAVPSLLLLLLFSTPKFLELKIWAPLRNYYLFAADAVFGFSLALFFLIINISSNGNPAPILYLPLINPLEIFSMVILLSLFKWKFSAQNEMSLIDRTIFNDIFSYVTGLLLFVFVNMTLARNIHFWADIPWRWNLMYDSMMVQMIYSIFWAITGLCFMVLGNRFMKRTIWIIGAFLMALVVVKLFFIDLSNTGAVFRIVSFVVVGIILLIIGYLAPVPKTIEGTGNKNKK